MRSCRFLIPVLVAIVAIAAGVVTAARPPKPRREAASATLQLSTLLAQQMTCDTVPADVEFCSEMAGASFANPLGAFEQLLQSTVHRRSSHSSSSLFELNAANEMNGVRARRESVAARISDCCSSVYASSRLCNSRCHAGFEALSAQPACASEFSSLASCVGTGADSMAVSEIGVRQVNPIIITPVITQCCQTNFGSIPDCLQLCLTDPSLISTSPNLACLAALPAFGLCVTSGILPTNVVSAAPSPTSFDNAIDQCCTRSFVGSCSSLCSAIAAPSTVPGATGTSDFTCLQQLPSFFLCVLQSGFLFGNFTIPTVLPTALPTALPTDLPSILPTNVPEFPIGNFTDVNATICCEAAFSDLPDCYNYCTQNNYTDFDSFSQCLPRAVPLIVCLIRQFRDAFNPSQPPATSGPAPTAVPPTAAPPSAAPSSANRRSNRRAEAEPARRALQARRPPPRRRALADDMATPKASQALPISYAYVLDRSLNLAWNGMKESLEAAQRAEHGQFEVCMPCLQTLKRYMCHAAFPSCEFGACAAAASINALGQRCPKVLQGVAQLLAAQHKGADASFSLLDSVFFTMGLQQCLSEKPLFDSGMLDMCQSELMDSTYCRDSVMACTGMDNVTASESICSQFPTGDATGQAASGCSSMRRACIHTPHWFSMVDHAPLRVSSPSQHKVCPNKHMCLSKQWMNSQTLHSTRIGLAGLVARLSSIFTQQQDLIHPVAISGLVNATLAWSRT
ncbi:hypothetical protein CAOG_02122 [Capsaspora owczarzaki ATCC 30864]|eukprot:XP_004348872.1 hypothetical protein CAOG_02122 [Capsaspora owczarzaki ATCC 30864]